MYLTVNILVTVKWKGLSIFSSWVDNSAQNVLAKVNFENFDRKKLMALEFFFKNFAVVCASEKNRFENSDRKRQIALEFFFKNSAVACASEKIPFENSDRNKQMALGFLFKNSTVVCASEKIPTVKVFTFEEIATCAPNFILLRFIFIIFQFFRSEFCK